MEASVSDQTLSFDWHGRWCNYAESLLNGKKRISNNQTQNVFLVNLSICFFFRWNDLISTRFVISPWKAQRSTVGHMDTLGPDDQLQVEGGYVEKPRTKCFFALLQYRLIWVWAEEWMIGSEQFEKLFHLLSGVWWMEGSCWTSDLSAFFSFRW